MKEILGIGARILLDAAKGNVGKVFAYGAIMGIGEVGVQFAADAIRRAVRKNKSKGLKDERAYAFFHEGNKVVIEQE